MRVALYARVSSESQQARGTIGSQLEVLRARIAGEGHELVAEFCDDGFSGARLERPGLDAMRDQAEAGVFEAVWCLSPDRLARAYVYQVLVLDELAQLGVRVVFADAPAIDDDDPQLRLLTQVQGVIAEYERAKIGERNRRGRLYRARAGEVVSWRAPYGYRRVARDGTGPARLEIFETEAAIVRRIYDDYLSGGHSIREIVRRLNADNIPTPTDRAQWWHSTVCRILTNEAYIGRVYFNQTETVTTLRNGRHSRTQRRRPREDWIAIACSSIIDDTAFEAAQKVSRDNSKWSPRNLPEDVEAWLLRRLVRCGPCDLALGCQKIVSPEGKVHRYYWCPNHADARVARQQRCPERNIRADTLDDFVFEQVRAALLRPDVLLAGQTALTAATPVPDDELLTVELSRIDRKLVANRAERRRLADLYQSGLLELTEVQQRARDIDARHCALTEQHEGLISQRHQLATDNQLRGRVTDFAQRAAAGIDKLGFNERQHLMRLVVEHVRVTGWQVEIQLRIPLDDGPGPPDTPPGGPPHTGDGDNSAKVTPRSTQPRQRTHREQVSTKDGLRSLRGVLVPEEG
jgi:site-specific DNA recombinase